MTGHAATKADAAPPRVAPDVASTATWPGPRKPDQRYFVTLEVAELPWPLIFGFVRVIADDGSERWACVSLDAGRPIGRDEEGMDEREVELTGERFRFIADRFDRYRLMAEARLIPRPEGFEQSQRIRRAMKRKRGEPWTRETLALLVNDWRALEREPGRMYTLAQRWGVTRSSVHRALERAEAEGLIEQNERRHSD